MRPRLRAVLLSAICVLLIAGLLLSGPAHFGVHKAGDGPSCDACAISGTTPDPVFEIFGPPREARVAIVLAPSAPPQSFQRLLPPSRGPPRLG
jgi:hypothetical protein